MDDVVGRRRAWWGAATLLALPCFAWAAFWYAPDDSAQGSAQRIFYVHVPSAWVAFLAFAVVAGASVHHLVTRRPGSDTLAAASAEVGLVFTTVVLITGMLWARPIWGVYWAWEPRLTSVLVLWLLYLTYLATRAYVADSDRRARFSAVVGIVAFLDVPVVYLSVRWWRTMHPEQVVLVRGGPRMPGEMLVALLVGLVTLTLVYVHLLRLRVAVHRLTVTVTTLQAEADDAAEDAGSSAWDADGADHRADDSDDDEPGHVAWPGQEVRA
jgi:heme exporter protein C